MAAKRILLKHEIKSTVEFLLCDTPRDKRAVREIRRDQSLAHTSDRSRFEHCADPLNDHVQCDSRKPRDFLERLSDKPLNLVLGYRKNLRVDRIVVFDGDG